MTDYKILHSGNLPQMEADIKASLAEGWTRAGDAQFVPMPMDNPLAGHPSVGLLMIQPMERSKSGREEFAEMSERTLSGGPS